MPLFKLISDYKPTGDQPKAIDTITNYLNAGHKYQSLWGVTGSGKTFVMANIIKRTQKPTLIIAHNKTLAAQLALEFQDFFPDAAVHYFVSYYDYYQPEAYVTRSDTYIEKEATINEEIDRLRHAATQDLIMRKDVIIVASVSCIYGVGDISAYKDSVLQLRVGESYSFDELTKLLVGMQYRRAGMDFKQGHFHIMGDLFEIFPSSKEFVYSMEFWGDELTRITERHPITGEVYREVDMVHVFPAKHTVTTKDRVMEVLPEIQKELKERLDFFESRGDVLRYERLKTKVEYDLEMMQEVGYVNGIENYSRYLDGRKVGEPPHTLIDYFGDDFLCFVDESHMTISQIGGMYAGDRSRKENLVEHGFRLPSALDHRPLQFDEFESKIPQMVLVSATPGQYDIEHSSNNPERFFEFDPLKDGAWIPSESERIVPLVIRPTGLLDPKITIHSMQYMADEVMAMARAVHEAGERMLITTLTKRSSEELSDYMLENGVKVRYLHSEIETLERLEILRDLRMGKIEVLVGVNLLREGLDLPEVTKIAILDADKQGFLRSSSSLIQIIGRAARNASGQVYMYGEQMPNFEFKNGEIHLRDGQILPATNSYLDDEGLEIPLYEFDKGKYLTSEGIFFSNAMRSAINLTHFRRKIQKEHNTTYNIIPQTVLSKIKDIGLPSKASKAPKDISGKELDKYIKKLELEMTVAAKNMDYELAAQLRDELFELRKKQ